MAKRCYRVRRLAEATERYGPDACAIEFVYPDGWTIRRPTTVNDVWRVGYLMRNCWIEEPGYGDLGPDPRQRALCDRDGFPRACFSHYDDGECVNVVGMNNRKLAEHHVERLARWPDAGPLQLSVGFFYEYGD